MKEITPIRTNKEVTFSLFRFNFWKMSVTYSSSCWRNIHLMKVKALRITLVALSQVELHPELSFFRLILLAQHSESGLAVPLPCDISVLYREPPAGLHSLLTWGHRNKTASSLQLCICYKVKPSLNRRIPSSLSSYGEIKTNGFNPQTLLSPLLPWRLVMLQVKGQNTKLQRKCIDIPMSSLILLGQIYTAV